MTPKKTKREKKIYIANLKTYQQKNVLSGAPVKVFFVPTHTRWSPLVPYSFPQKSISSKLSSPAFLEIAVSNIDRSAAFRPTPAKARRSWSPICEDTEDVEYEQGHEKLLERVLRTNGERSSVLTSITISLVDSLSDTVCNSFNQNISRHNERILFINEIMSFHTTINDVCLNVFLCIFVRRLHEVKRTNRSETDKKTIVVFEAGNQSIRAINQSERLVCG